jgi:hypothetical protein
MPRPIPKPPRTEEVLAAVAARYPAGATVTGRMIAEAGGVNLATAGQIPQWARAHGRMAVCQRQGSQTESGPTHRPVAPDQGGLVVDG